MTRILYFGITGVLSVAPLQRILNAGADVAAVILPLDRQNAGRPPRLVPPQSPAITDVSVIPLQGNETIAHIAWERQIPVWEVGRLTADHALDLLKTLQPDLICVVCFPYLFPKAVLDLPKWGCLNLHPSLLPAYRGPMPLFWQFQRGEKQIGVTLHFLDEGIDSGDIVRQTAFEIPDGVSEAELTAVSAIKGAALLEAALHQLATDSLPRRPQLETDSSYFPVPSETDFQISTAWSARRAFNFLRGASQWPLTIQVHNGFFSAIKAIEFDAERVLEDPYIYRVRDQIGLIQFNPGTVKVKGLLTPHPDVVF